ncbi:DUF4291 family protein [Cellulomonas chengniuliangii]|uniref:DUF4291 family protein n=1 Tax=Cellulomonas chengniuliangii TaxID=2968084 RepID=UPI001D0EE84D|nr:DUF4291 domain-containing protein [Cellulomonas chengniuliangii]
MCGVDAQVPGLGRHPHRLRGSPRLRVPEPLRRLRLLQPRGKWRARKEASPVRVQWDPERDLRLDPLPWRSHQIGLSGVAVQSYLHDWIISIDDITERVQALRTAAFADPSLLPAERPYPLPDLVAQAVGAER